ncbi:hypothetical protein QJS66_21580 [Kocuria rhizophila]|nr:hypothetical protein QJS66_21580 [Kocuria rhizophila]
MVDDETPGGASTAWPAGGGLPSRDPGRPTGAARHLAPRRRRGRRRSSCTVHGAPCGCVHPCPGSTTV